MCWTWCLKLLLFWSTLLLFEALHVSVRGVVDCTVHFDIVRRDVVLVRHVEHVPALTSHVAHHHAWVVGLAVVVQEGKLAWQAVLKLHVLPHAFDGRGDVLDSEHNRLFGIFQVRRDDVVSHVELSILGNNKLHHVRFAVRLGRNVWF